MASKQAGAGHVAIFPVFKGFGAALAKETNTATGNAGRSGGKSFASGFQSAVSGTDLAGSAVKRLQGEVQKATQALSKARLTEADAAGKVRAAEAALNDARKTGEAGSSRVVAAEERLAAAKRRLTQASGQTTAASNQLKAAQAGLASQTEQTAATGQRGASRFAQGWAGVKDRLMSALRGGVRSAGAAAESEARSSGSRAGSLFSSSLAVGLGNIGAQLANRIGGALKSAVSTGFSVAAGLETAEIGFTTMLGSAEKARTFLGQLSDFAAKTPFDLPGLQKSASSLVAIGVDANDVIPIMKTIGNVTSGMGTGAEGVGRATTALQQMIAAQKISGEDLNQLRDAGIPVYDLLASATGKSKDEVVKLAQSGKLGKKELTQMLDALKSGKGLERFSGLMDKQSQSLSGLLSTMKDTFGVGMATALQPVIPLVKGVLSGLNAAMEPAFAAVAGGAQRMVDTITGAFQLLKTGDFTGEIGKLLGVEEDSAAVGVILGIRDAVIGVRDAWKGFSSVFQGTEFAGAVGPIGEVAEALRGMVDQVGGQIGPILQQVGPGLIAALQPLLPVIGQLFAGFAQAGPQLSPLMIILQAITPIIPQLVQAFVSLGTAVASILSSALATVLPVLVQLGGLVTSQLVPALTTLISAVLPPLSALFGVVAQVVGQVLAAVMPLVSALIAILIPVISQLVTMLAPLIAQLIGALAPALQLVGQIVAMVAGLIGTVLMPIIRALMPVITTVFGVIVQVISAALQIITGIINVVMGVLTGNWDQAWQGILGILSGVWNLIRSVVEGALKIVQSVLVGTWNAIVGITTNVWRGIGATVTGAWNAVIGFVKGIQGQIVGAVNTVWNGAKTATSTAWTNLKDAVIAGIGTVVTTVSEVPGKITGALGDLGGLLSGAGQKLIQGLIDGIRGMLGSVGSAMGEVAGKVKGFLPGSPVKEGPLTSWNNGGAGKRLAQMLADGLVDSTGLVAAASARLAGAVGLDDVALPGAGPGSSAVRRGGLTVNTYNVDPHSTAIAVEQRFGALMGG